MLSAQPSRTAYRVALRRAAHQLLDRPSVLDDPVAVPILGQDTAASLRQNPARFESSPIDIFMRAFMAVRARFAEDHLASARAAGVRQYVVLGAGLDTFAYRQPPDQARLRIWEVDHPATQAWKREMLSAAGIAVPANVEFVAVDFERDTLPRALACAGLDAGAGAVFSWLGVTPYLTLDAITATLDYIATVIGAHGGVTFDYALSRSLLTPVQQQLFDRLAERVERAGEPWRTTFAPGEIEARLRSMGFGTVEDASPAIVNARYFQGRTDGLRVGGLAHLVWAGR